ncbi:MAG: hypothetical protein SVR04_15995, partial [Spirochaetota bacterium]|nr:hypothetical protein [Spirochaetota bacterium]
SIRNIRDYFGLTDTELKHINRRDIRLMSNIEFNQYKDKIEEEAFRVRETRDARNELEALRKEKQFKAEENIRKFHKLPPIKKMSKQQLVEYANILAGYEQNDQFMTPKRIKALEQTEWAGAKTHREVLEKAARHFDVPLSALQDMKVDERDRFRYDSALARQNPFYEYMVDAVRSAEIRSNMKYFEEREKLFDLGKKAQKSRKRGAVGRLVPQMKEVMAYLEATPENKAAAALDLTKEELAFAEYVQEFYRKAYDYLLINHDLQSSRFEGAYVMHGKRPLSELLVGIKDTGFKSALKDVWNRWRLDQAHFRVLDSKTGEILPMHKFFRQTLYRKRGTFSEHPRPQNISCCISLTVDFLSNSPFPKLPRFIVSETNNHPTALLC